MAATSTEGVLLLDASVWVASRDPDDRYQAQALELTFDTDRAAATLDLTLYEIANGVVRRWGDPAAAARRYDWQLVSTDVRDFVSKGLAITPDAAV